MWIEIDQTKPNEILEEMSEGSLIEKVEKEFLGYIAGFNACDVDEMKKQLDENVEVECE